jgi:hypothetical protein
MIHYQNDDDDDDDDDAMIARLTEERWLEFSQTKFEPVLPESGKYLSPAQIS